MKLFSFIITITVTLLLVISSPSKYDNTIDSNNMQMHIYESKTYFQMWYELANQIVDRNSNISISRYGDGEYAIMVGKQTKGIDNFNYKGGVCKIREELFKSLKCQSKGRCYFGVYYKYLTKFLKWSNHPYIFFTTSNIFVNRNYPKTKALIESLIIDEKNNIILFCNNKATNTSFAKKVIYFPENIIEYYESYNDEIIYNATSLAKYCNKCLFILSIGPLAPVLIWHMRNANANNRYIDFGSTTDILLKGKTNRDYVDITSKNGKLIDKKWIVLRNKSIVFT